MSGIVLGSGVAATDYTFGELSTASLAGSVFVDANNNGVKDAAEPGIAGVTVALTGTNDQGTAVFITTSTNASGDYTFANLRPSSIDGYTLTETQPAGFFDGKDAVGTAGGSRNNDVISSILLTSGTNGTDYTFGELIPASISGDAFVDQNESGAQDAGDTAVAGATVTLTGKDDLGNSVILTTTTDVNGNYEFTGLRPSGGIGYTLTETQPPGSNAGASLVGSNGGAPEANAIVGIPLASGDDAEGYLFAQLATGHLIVMPGAQNVQTVQGPGPDVLVGGSVNLQFTLTNTYSSTVTNVGVDHSASPISCPSTTIPSGGSITCTSDTVAPLGAQTYSVQVSAETPQGAFGLTSTAFYFGDNPAASLTTTTDGSDSTVSPGPTVTAGAPIVVTLTNTGNVALTQGSFSAGALGVACPSDSLGLGDSENCTSSVSASTATTALTATAHFIGPNVFGADGSATQSTAQAAGPLDFVVRPTVTSVDPVSGTSAGGTLVHIFGTGFVGSPNVFFGTAEGTVIAFTPTLIAAYAPAGTGTVDVTAVLGGQTSATSAADQYTYLEPPTVTSMDFSAGPAGGGSFIHLTGTGFTGATSVSFGSTPAFEFVVESSTVIDATVPLGVGTVDVTVTGPGGTSATSAADQWTYYTFPTITSISPSSGPVAGGTPVTLTGTSLDGVLIAQLGIKNLSFVINSPTSMTVTTPADTGTVRFIVGGEGESSATGFGPQFTFVAPPTITGVTPVTGSSLGGTTVSITGTNLLGATAIDFGSGPSTDFVVNSPTSATAITPTGTGTVDVTATTPGGTSATSAADQFTFVHPATITSISPARGPIAGGTVVTIRGAGFTGATAVTFGGVDATSFTVHSDSSITATAPPGSIGAARVVVTTPAGLSTAGTFTYTAAKVLGLTGADPLPGVLFGLVLLLMGAIVLMTRVLMARRLVRITPHVG